MIKSEKDLAELEIESDLLVKRGFLSFQVLEPQLVKSLLELLESFKSHFFST